MLSFIKFFSSPSKDIDKGWSWMVLLASLVSAAFTWGIQHVISIIYNALLEDFKTDKATIAWITALPIFMLFFFSPLFAILANRIGGFQILSFIGAVISALSFFVSSFVENVYWLFFTYSILLGVGTLLLATPQFITLQQYFYKYASSTTALVTIASFVSPLFLSPMLHYLVDQYSWRFAFRILSMVILFICAPFTILWRNHSGGNVDTVIENVKIQDTFTKSNGKKKDEESEDETRIKKINKKTCNLGNKEICANESKKNVQNFKLLLRDKYFIILLIAKSIVALEWIVSMTHLVRYAIEFGVSTKKASMLPIFAAGGNITGRLIFGRLFDLKFIKCITFYKLLMTISGMISFVGPYMKSYEYLIGFTVIYTFFDGGHKSQIAIIVRNITGEERFMEGWSILRFFQSFMLVLGPILVGVLTDLYGNYSIMFYLMGVPQLLCVIILHSMVYFDRKHRTVENNGMKNVIENNNV